MNTTFKTIEQNRMRSSGFCVYPEMKFNMDKIMEYVS